jgi:hypothetical protein
MHSGHGVVQDDGIDWMGGEELQAGGAVGGGEYPIACALKQNLANAETDSFVVHAEDQRQSILHFAKLHRCLPDTTQVYPEGWGAGFWAGVEEWGAEAAGWGWVE